MSSVIPTDRQAAVGRRVALLVATYQYQDSGLRQLTSPAHDAESLAAVLGDPAIAGFEVTTLINEPHYKVGQVIGELYRNRRRDDLTLLYFTGHGLKDDGGQLHLAMTNTQSDNLLFTALPAEQVDYAMEGCASRQKVLILDCCYSGAFPADRLTKADTQVHALESFQGRGRIVLTASDATQYSFEGNQLHGQAEPSVFTRHLVAGLRDGSADLDGDGDITLDELYSYVYDRVVEEMPRQRPKKQDNVEGRIVIARNINWSLPTHLRNAINSPIATDRLNALDGLAHLHRIGNDVVRGHVGEEIRSLVDDDSRTVSAAAAERLRSILLRPGEPPAERSSETPVLRPTSAASTLRLMEPPNADSTSSALPTPPFIEISRSPLHHTPSPPHPWTAAVPHDVPLSQPHSPPTAPASSTPRLADRATTASRPVMAIIGFTVAAVISVVLMVLERGPDTADPAIFEADPVTLHVYLVGSAAFLAAVAIGLIGFVPDPSAASQHQRALFLPGILGSVSGVVLQLIALVQSLPLLSFQLTPFLLITGMPVLAVVGQRAGVWSSWIAGYVGFMPVWLFGGWFLVDDNRQAWLFELPRGGLFMYFNFSSFIVLVSIAFVTIRDFPER